MTSKKAQILGGSSVTKASSYIFREELRLTSSTQRNEKLVLKSSGFKRCNLLKHNLK